MSKRIQTFFSDETFAKLDDIAKKKGTTDTKGVMNITMTLSVTIADMHAKLYPEYITTLKNRNQVTPQEIAEKKVALEGAKDKARANKERDANVNICSLIDGSELVVIEGREYCQYPVYTMPSPHIVDTTIVKEPIGLMNEELPNLQYTDIMGNKGHVAKARIERVLRQMAKKEETAVKVNRP